MVMCRGDFRVNCPVACVGLKNPLAHLLAGQPLVPPERAEEVLTILQSNILDPNSVSPLLELCMGRYGVKCEFSNISGKNTCRAKI